MKVVNGYLFADALFRPEGIDYEEIGLEPQFDQVPIRFKLSEVACWNEATNGKTRIVLEKSGFNFNVDIDFYEFDKIMTT